MLKFKAIHTHELPVMIYFVCSSQIDCPYYILSIINYVQLSGQFESLLLQ